MKNWILGAVLSLGIFAAPAFTQAAGLTTAQSTSLIAVVQSSPGTPASAFVNLITAFSNITVNQATSLIAVVQASPSTPAIAFVDLLTSFTADTVAPETSVGTGSATTLYQPPQPVLDTDPPRINLKPMSNKWKESKLFPNGLWGVLGLEEWNYVTDNSKVMGEALNVFVQWSVDGVPLEPERKIDIINKSKFDTTRFSNGGHILILKATDATGNSNTASIQITINNQ